MSALVDGFGLPAWEPGGAVAVGVFDGVHAGHRRLVDVARAWAADRDAVASGLTFDPHPSALFRPAGRVAPLLQTLDDRLATLAHAGLARVAVARFDRAFAVQDPEQFVDTVLLGRLGAACVVVGEDFRFGAGQAGDVRVLEELGRRKGFALEVVPEVRVDGVPARSTVIRGRIEDGDVAGAARLLGRPHGVRGIVAPGRRLGRTIGFPTANLAVPEGLVVPGSGVYAAWARGTFGKCPAAVSIGVNVTVDPDASPTVEAHLLDWSGDLYGEPLALEFVARLRGMAAFAGLDALKAAIDDDVRRARGILTETVD